jgi:hypothetical protein
MVPDVLEAGESVEFPFRLSADGKLRLKLQYWQGSNTDLDCDKPPKRKKVATSPVFFQSTDPGKAIDNPR